MRREPKQGRAALRDDNPADVERRREIFWKGWRPHARRSAAGGSMWRSPSLAAGTPPCIARFWRRHASRPPRGYQSPIESQ
jgi:hypothetical protein